jgi:hypothetical protein
VTSRGRGDDSDDTVVVDTVNPGSAISVGGAAPAVTARGTREQSPLARAPAVTARGTREQLPLTREPAVTARGTGEQLPLARDPGPARGTRDLVRERDSVRVLRMWPHSMAMLDERDARAKLVREHGEQRTDERIALARLALEMYREIDDVQADAHDAHRDQPTSAKCGDPACEARTAALRGALIEACLMVQRVSTLASSVDSETLARVRELLRLIER